MMLRFLEMIWYNPKVGKSESGTGWMMPVIMFEDIRKDVAIRSYIESADKTLSALGYTEHSLGHTMKCAETVRELLCALGYGEREIELGRIAAYLHDIGNVVNRSGHAHSGALMAFHLLERFGMPPEETAVIVAAIGHHDEHTAFPVNAVAAALILADKSDVRRSRVRNQDRDTFDIHDRVNFAVERSALRLSKTECAITLDIGIDAEICTVMDYFEIFIARMQLCRSAANFFGYQFKLVINETVMM